MVDDLVAPAVRASVLRLSAAADADERIVFSTPADPELREKLTLRHSFDQAASWAAGPVSHEGPAAYSDLVETSSGMLGILYENGSAGPYEQITFARASLDE
ncbi:MAG: hypothetical protein ACRDXX_13760 [Stackebrandtia sp.]